MKYRKWMGKDELSPKIEKRGQPWVCVFAAKWCGYCRRFLLLMDSLPDSEENPEVFVVDADSGDGSIWDEFEIPVVPTIATYVDGKQVFKKVGRAGAGLTESDLKNAFSTAKEKGKESQS